MNKKRFTIQSTATELELYDDNDKIGEFPHFEWVAESVTSVVDLLNEQQATINLLLELLYLSEEIIIGEISSTIDEDIDELGKLFKRNDIKEIERYVRGDDYE